MDPKNIVIIDTDPSFSERFNARLKYRKLDSKFKLINVELKTVNKDEMIQKCIEDTKKIILNTEIAAVLVDIHLIESGAKLDTSGIPLAVEIKNIFPTIPVYNVTGKVSLDEQLELVSDATMELNDGVLVKSYFEEGGLTERRLMKIVKPRYSKMLCDDIEQKQGQKVNNEKRDADVAIITALYEDEFENIKPIFNLERDRSGKNSNYHFGVFKTKAGQETKIIATYQPTTGMVDAAILASDILIKFNPKYLIMTGVCGGKDAADVSFGDIVVADKVFTFQKGKITDLEQQIEHEVCEVDHNLISRIRENQDEIIFNIQNEDRSRKSYYRKHPIKLFIQPMACSLSVINKEGYFTENIESVNRNTIAVDMESYAIARACVLLNNGTRPVIVKSIMDKTKEKSDESKSFAAYTSAQFLKHLVTTVLF